MSISRDFSTTSPSILCKVNSPQMFFDRFFSINMIGWSIWKHSSKRRLKSWLLLWRTVAKNPLISIVGSKISLINNYYCERNCNITYRGNTKYKQIKHNLNYLGCSSFLTRIILLSVLVPSTKGCTNSTRTQQKRRKKKVKKCQGSIALSLSFRISCKKKRLTSQKMTATEIILQSTWTAVTNFII